MFFLCILDDLGAIVAVVADIAVVVDVAVVAVAASMAIVAVAVDCAVVAVLAVSVAGLHSLRTRLACLALSVLQVSRPLLAFPILTALLHCHD